VKYKEIGDGVFIGPDFQVFDKLYTPKYDTKTFTGVLLDENGEEVSWVERNDLKSLKRELKQLLIYKGVKFYPEVRNKKEDINELLKALEEKENEQ
jgi:hypothetical protein